MPEPQFPVPVEQIAGTLLALLRAQGEDRLVSLLESSTAELIYHGSSSYGDYHEEWRLRLSIPVARYARIEADTEKIEKTLTRKAAQIALTIDGHCIVDVVLAPRLVMPNSATLPPPPVTEIERIFGKDRFRLFISHKTKDKVFLSELKEALSYLGVSSFLAHEDIEPTTEWQHEIELALRSMQAMVTYLTTDFGKSDWTDQEIGWAMGRGVFVIPVKVDINPYGFMAKVHAVQGHSVQAVALADKILAQLIKNPQTHAAMRASLVYALGNAKGYHSAQRFRSLLAPMENFTDKEKQSLLDAVEHNGQVSGAFGVSEWIQRTFGNPQPTPAEDDLPF